MCLIIKTDNPNKLNLNLLETAYNNNSDGFGVMFYNKGKLHTQKIAPKTFKDIERDLKILSDTCPNCKSPYEKNPCECGVYEGNNEPRIEPG